MYVGVYNPDVTPVTVRMDFESGPGQRWNTSLTVGANSREAVAVHTVVPIVNGQSLNFGTKVTFPPGRVGAVSFALWHDSNYGRDRVVDLTPTVLCSVPQ